MSLNVHKTPVIARVLPAHIVQNISLYRAIVVGIAMLAALIIFFIIAVASVLVIIAVMYLKRDHEPHLEMGWMAAMLVIPFISGCIASIIGGSIIVLKNWNNGRS
ncbi:MAG: hypothetical protein HZC28_07525 [Spirochaetes bacterium]|nr:hypothetical protein [Spirochaetota bacterium]